MLLHPTLFPTPNDNYIHDTAPHYTPLLHTSPILTKRVHTQWTTQQNEKSQQTNNNWRERKAPNGIEALPKKETRSNTVFI
mmetsp:Transcript_11012/g.12350  ORF Transcript_11012/g.12350 Transcript_11012/m.12350 type:complete len:81 (-) Transcript_11012:395-637(-)